MKKAKKIINFRLPFAIALALAFGIIFSCLISYYNVNATWYFAAIPLAAVVFIICALALKNNQFILCCAVVLLVFLIGVGYSALKIVSYQKNQVSEDYTYKISGVVDEVGSTAKGNAYIIVSSVSVGGKDIDGKVLAYLGDYAGNYCDAGDEVTFYSSLEKYDVFAYGKFNTYAMDGVKYYCTIYSSLSSTHKFNLFGTIRSGIYGTLYDNLNSETAAVAYAMITGNTGGISTETLSSFRYGGVAHIFAVSGLHIGVVYGALALLFKKLRMGKYLSTTLIIAILVFYSGVCGFTASSVRAVIMCSVRALSKLIYQKYDSLNSLSFSVIILLAVNPFYIFATGFILSVSAVSGIIFLSRQIKSKLKFLPNKISDAISVGLGAQIATFPALLITFGYVSVVGLVLNLVVLPILSLLYIIMFVCTIICTVIFPIAPYIMPYAALPLEVVINFFVTCGFENGIISGFGSAFIYVSIILFIAAFTDKLNIKLTVRSVIACLSAVVFTFAYIYESVVPSYQLRIIASAYYDGGMVIVKSNEGSVLIITQDLSVVNISTFLNENCLTKPNALIILGDDESLAKYYEWGGDVDAVYLSESLVHASGTDGLTVNYVNKFYLFGVDYEFCDSASLQITFNGVHVGICADEESNLTQTNVLLSVYQLDDVVADEVFYFNPVATDCDCYNIYDCGCLHFKINGDKLKLTDIMPNLRR